MHSSESPEWKRVIVVTAKGEMKNRVNHEERIQRQLRAKARSWIRARRPPKQHRKQGDVHEHEYGVGVGVAHPTQQREQPPLVLHHRIELMASQQSKRGEEEKVEVATASVARRPVHPFSFQRGLGQAPSRLERFGQSPSKNRNPNPPTLDVVALDRAVNDAISIAVVFLSGHVPVEVVGKPADDVRKTVGVEVRGARR